MRRKSVHNKNERKVINMAKAGMKRPDPSEPHGTESNKKQKHPKNDNATCTRNPRKSKTWE